MTGEQRNRVRDEIDSRRRATLSTARPGFHRSPVVKAAEHAHRAQDAKVIVADVIGERPATDRCQFCGAPTKGDVCRSHADLLENGL